MTPFRKILVPVDFSEHSDLALQTAAALSRSYEAPLTVIYVYEPLALAVPDGYMIFTEAQLRDMAMTAPGVTRALAGKEIKRVVVRPPKLVNIVAA